MEITLDTRERPIHEILEFQNGKFDFHSEVNADEWGGDMDSRTVELPDDFRGAVVTDHDFDEGTEAERKEALMQSVQLLGFESEDLKNSPAEESWYCYLAGGESEHSVPVKNREEELKLLASEPRAIGFDLVSYRVSSNDEHDQQLYKPPSWEMLRATEHFVLVEKGEITANLRGSGSQKPKFDLDEEGRFLLKEHPVRPNKAYFVAEAEEGGFVGVERVSDDGKVTREPIGADIGPHDRVESKLDSAVYESGWILRYDDVQDEVARLNYFDDPPENNRCTIVMGTGSALKQSSNLDALEAGVKPTVLTAAELKASLPQGEFVLDNMRSIFGISLDQEEIGNNPAVSTGKEAEEISAPEQSNDLLSDFGLDESANPVKEADSPQFN